MKRIVVFFVLFAMLVVLGGCGGSSSSSSASVSSNVLVNWVDYLADGGSVTWSLSPGTYQLQMTSSPNGASVEWLPNNGCLNVNEVKAYTSNCTLSINGQVKVTNPTTFGLGPSESVTVRIIRL